MFFAPKSADVRICRTPYSLNIRTDLLFAKYPHWSNPTADFFYGQLPSKKRNLGF